MKCPPVMCTNLFKSNSSIHVVGDKYSFTRACNAMASLIASIKSLKPPSYWYDLSYNSKGSLCELFRRRLCVFYL